jgi:pyrroline-5-carboxylate reductase
MVFIGCGVMAESMIAGLLREGILTPDKITASHPRKARQIVLEEKHGIPVFEKNREAVEYGGDAVIVLCVKPQRVKAVMAEIADAVRPGQMVLSIVAGCRIKAIAKALGTDKVARTMPNTPAQIGRGITAWTATDAVTEEDRAFIRSILSALGREMFVENEHMIDMATSLSATGPTYIFMVMEALTDAGVHLGFSRDVSKELVQETMLGSVLFAMESDKHPAELRNMVTSPGGTSADAIYQMEKGGLRTVLSKAVYAAYKRAVDLGEKED